MDKRYTFFLFIGLFCHITTVFAQPQDRFVDSLKKGLAAARTDEDRVQALINLSMASFQDPALVESYDKQAIEVAEMSRDRRLMALTYLSMARHYLNNPVLSDNVDRAVAYLSRAEEIARTNGLEVFLVRSYDDLSRAWRSKGDKQKEMSYSNQALAAAGNNDTARVIAFTSMGDSHLDMDEKLLAFRNYLEAMDVAEKSGKDNLMREVYVHTSRFYSSIHDYAKAIDYRMKTYVIDRKAWDVEGMLSDKYNLGDLFLSNKQDDLALKMYEDDIALADSLHYDLLTIDAYFRIFNMYFNRNQYVEGVRYMEKHQQIYQFLKNSGFQFYLDQIRGMSLAELGKFDSADYFFRKAEPEVEKTANPEGHYNFYTSAGDFNVQRKNYPLAIRYYEKAFRLAESIKGLEMQVSSAQQLDSLYGLTGDYKLAHFYNIRYHQVRDSIQDMSKDAEVLKLEVENDNQRRERLAQEEEVRLEHRHNLQYLGFTVGLVVLFIILVMLGWFAVPAGMIRALGFVSFIFLFEFIILLADKSIQRWTHEEPWKVLVIKIGLAAILVPLHHWLEHKVIHYLSHRKRVTREAGVHVPAEA